MKKHILIVCLVISGLVGSFELAFAERSNMRRSGSRHKGNIIVKKVAPEPIEDEYDIDRAPAEDLDIATPQEDGGVPTEEMFEEPAAMEPRLVIGDTGEKGSLENEKFDAETKRKQVIDLVERGMEYLKKNVPSQVFKAFSHTDEFKDGELYLFVYTDKGICLAHGQDSSFIWKNQIELRDSFGTPIIQAIIDKANNGGGWITYQWRNATKVSYVQEVKKDDQRYIIGAGYYPHSKKDGVVSLVKGAVALFNDLKEKGRPSSEAFSTFNYPMGRFVNGNLYLFAMDFTGIMMSQADRPGLVGINSLDTKDDDGKFPNKEIINKLKATPNDGVWVTYMSKRAKKWTYAERVEDEEGKNYFIAAGFYPDADREAAVDLVKKGYTYFKAHGVSIAREDFSSKSNYEFRYGDLYLAVYDTKGKCIANGENEELIGQNMLDAQDGDGRFYVQELIKKAKKDSSGWVDIKAKNSFESIYVEYLDLGIESYIITCGVFPITKADTASLLVRSGVSYLQANPEDKVFAEFTETNGRFIRGDLELFVYDDTGLCYAYGDDSDRVWVNDIDKKDDDGKSYVKLFINTAKSGAAKVTYKIKGSRNVTFVDRVEKDGTGFTIGSGFFK